MVRYYPWNLAPDRLIRISFWQGVQKSSRDALPPPLKQRQLKRASARASRIPVNYLNEIDTGTSHSGAH